MSIYSIDYPGFDQKKGTASISMIRGVDPGVIQFEIAPGTTASPPTGPVALIKDGVKLFELVGCALHNASRSSGDSGTGYTVTLLDRRWKWKEGGGYISGHFNRKNPDGSIISGSQKSAKELIELLLDQLGETGYNTSAASGLTDPPEVQWDHVRPVEALSSLLGTLGLELVLRHTTGNPVRIVVPGQGASLPSSPRMSGSQDTLAGISTPDKLALICGETLIEGMFELEPVGRDDGDIWKAVNSVSYKPTDGWEKEDPEFFSAVDGSTPEEAKTRRDRAKADIFRAYRVKAQANGGNTIPGLDYSVENIWQYQLQDRLLSNVERSDNQLQWKSAEVYGIWFKEGFKVVNETFGAKYDGDFSFVPNEPIIVFSEPIRRISASNDYAFPKLFLRCVYSVLNATTRAPLRHVREKNLGGSAGTGAKPFRHDDVYRTLSISYSANSGSESYDLGAVTDSQETTNAVADYYLTAHQQIETPTSGEDVPYGGWVNIECDGKIQQVTFSLRGGVASTRASTGTEHSSVIPKPKVRKRLAKMNSILAGQQSMDAGVKTTPAREFNKSLSLSHKVASKAKNQDPMRDIRWFPAINMGSNNLAGFAPVKMADDEESDESTDQRDPILKVIALTEVGIDGSQAIAFVDMKGIVTGKMGRVTFDLPIPGLIKGSAQVAGPVYAGTDEDMLVTDDPGGSLNSFQALHFIKAVGDDELWIIGPAPTAGGQCDEVHEFYMEGNPTSGDCDLGYTLIRDPDVGSPTYEALTFPYNSTATGFRDILLTHDVVLTSADVQVGGGPWPDTPIYVIWKGDFARAIELPSRDSTGLNNGARVKMRKASSANWKGFI